MQRFYITTPIYYVNDEPHIGHTCTTIVADIIARSHKLAGEDVFFLTGTDEHGVKVAEEAEKTGLEPKEFCDKISQNYKEIWPKLNIKYNYFIRTTNPDHEKIVQEIITRIYKKGDIYKGKYEGLYCIGCEKFITETDLVNSKCPFHPNRPIQKQSEENYFFKLSKYVPQLIKAIENDNDQCHYQISPLAKREEVLSKLKAGISDISVSRANVPWGIPIPWDKSQTIYVWVDALLNYYTALKITGKEKFWPANLHLVGKEILWFHAVIWEAMLISAGLTLPKEIFAHSFYMIDGQKMSKSLGNVISPQELIEKFGVDGTRYLIASSFPYENDSNIGWKKFTEKYNADLANGLGNLVSRTAKLWKTSRCSPKSLPKFSYGNTLDPMSVVSTLENIWINRKWGIQAINQMIDHKKIWNLKGENARKAIMEVVGMVLNVAKKLTPFLPDTAGRIEKIFRLGEKLKSPLFPRVLL